MNKADNYKGFIMACSNGNMSILKYLHEIFKDDEMIKNDNYKGFIMACENNHI